MSKGGRPGFGGVELSRAKAEILIAEDSKAQSEALASILTENGYSVHAVENGLEGLYELMTIRPNLIVSDVWMPKMNGYEFCRAVKDDKKLHSIPVILLTSLSDIRDIVKGLEAGADYYLTKPYDKQVLLSAIEVILADVNTEPRGNRDDKKAMVEIKTGEETLRVAVEPQKIVNYLLSTYQNMLHQNRNLEQIRLELKKLNNHLEERVQEKTRFLEEEILERKKAQAALVESEEKYRSIFENAIDGIFRSTPEGTFLSVNPAYARMLGFSSAQEMYGASDYIRNRRYVDPEDWAALGHALGTQGSVQRFETRIFRRDGRAIWIAMNAHAVRDSLGRVQYYEGTVEDITESRKAGEALNESLENLRKSLDGTVRALATTIEMRDPYTAGHQRRVAQLACAIAGQLGFAEDRVEGMQVIGFLHDIGKIVVPAEILSKPGELNDLEFNMIKAHSQVGYNILKGIEFPWPVSVAVLQHHERLDGSGYPEGIKGDDLILEARILAVADVVESMASHRPYRPALGIDQALHEVSRHRGVLYDPLVVDACIKALEEGGLTLQ